MQSSGLGVDDPAIRFLAAATHRAESLPVTVSRNVPLLTQLSIRTEEVGGRGRGSRAGGKYQIEIIIAAKSEKRYLGSYTERPNSEV